MPGSTFLPISSSEEESSRPRFGVFDDFRRHKTNTRFLRTPLCARLQGEPQRFLQRKFERRRTAGQQHQIRQQHRLIRNILHAGRSIDDDNIRFFIRRFHFCAHAIRRATGNLHHALRKHSFALFGPGDEAVLRIGIEHRDFLAHGRELAGQIARNRSLADPALSPRNHNHGHGEYYNLISTRAAWVTRLGDAPDCLWS